MQPDLERIINKFPSLKVLVIGEAFLDCYLKGSVERVCREAPVPIVKVDETNYTLGGAGNTVLNLRALGARVTFLTVIGADRDGAMIRKILLKNKVDVSQLVIDLDSETHAKKRVMAANQMVVRIDYGTTSYSDQTQKELEQKVSSLFPQFDVIVISDYGYGILTERIIKQLEIAQSKYPRVVVADAKDLSCYKQVGVTAVKPNYMEAVKLLNLDKQAGEKRLTQILSASKDFLKITGADMVAVTLDADGAIIFDKQFSVRTYSTPSSDAQAIGAGDTFVSSLALSLGAGALMSQAVQIASTATQVILKQEGTAVCLYEELLTQISGADGKLVTSHKWLHSLVTSYKKQGKKIVFTNGCFDILHKGHVEYLQKARGMGDVLLIGLNSDESVKRLKGKNRPINNLEDRTAVLEALGCVDHVIPFEENTPINLIKIIKPNVYVKGGDYTRETLPETRTVEKFGGEVEIIPLVQNRSTTSIIKKIREQVDKPLGNNQSTSSYYNQLEDDWRNTQ